MNIGRDTVHEYDRGKNRIGCTYNFFKIRGYETEASSFEIVDVFNRKIISPKCTGQNAVQVFRINYCSLGPAILQ